MRVLLLGGGLQGLSCGCSLYKRHEVSIVTADLMCRKSRFFKSVFSDVNSSDESLYDLLRRRQFDVLIPISDLNVPFISKNKDYIENQFGVKCAVPDYSLVYCVEDKSRFMAFCEENRITHPQTVALCDDNLYEAASSVGFPALIKPDYSVGARGITRVDSIEELVELFPLVRNSYGTCTLQEYVDNKEYYFNVMLYRNSRGDVLAYSIIKIVRMYPVSGGSSSCGITVENDELLALCKDCLDKMGWVGMADFDVLQRLDTKEYKIIEINPRVPASLRAAEISGVNFPEVIICDTLNREVPAFTYRSGKVLRYMGIDLLWLLKSPNRFRAKPDWFHFIGKNMYYQDIYRNDSSTWWTWLASGILKMKSKKKRIR